MKLNSKIHGIIDYFVVLFFWVSPMAFGLGETTAWFTYILGGIHLLLTLFTNFEMGVFKVIPFKLHGWIELVVSIALIGVAFYLGRLDGTLSRNFYLGVAVAIFLTWLITDYKTEQRKV